MAKRKTQPKKKTKNDLSPLEEIHGPLPQLKPADIIFIRHKGNILRSFLRKVIGSYWDHVALVLYPRDLSRQRSKTVIVESKKGSQISIVHTRGTAIHQLNKYLQDPKKYDVAIGRVKQLSDQERERVVTFMLMNVDAPYWPWTGWLLIFSIFSKRIGKLYLSQQRFSCSGLIQQAFYDAMDWNEKNKVIFKTGIWSPVELQELTNPGDIGSSEHIEFIYNKH
ncbi:MAG: hypothetical protein ABIG66_03345 [Candidatus Kerfeldbacteria bacterium]